MSSVLQTKQATKLSLAGFLWYIDQTMNLLIDKTILLQLILYRPDSFCSVVLTPFALHTRGPLFDTRQKQT